MKATCRFGTPVLIGIDANCQMYVSDQFKDWCLPVKGGEHLANFISMCKCIDELGINSPAGEEGNHTNIGEFGTYNPTVGNSSMVIDHIGTIGSIQVMPKSISTDPSLARACSVDKDHISICAVVIISVSKSDNNHERRRVIQYDLSKILDKERADAFRSRLRDFPVVGVEVENSSRCHLIQHYVHEALLDCFPKSKVQKKKDYITESTFKCILEGRALCKQMFKIGRFLASLFIRVIFRAGKELQQDF